MINKLKCKCCVGGRKGGNGKTSITGEIAYKLSLSGEKTLMIDLDYQMNLSSWFLKGDIDNYENTIYEVLKQECNIKKAIININENLDIIIASENLAGLDMELTKEGKEFTLSKILKEIENNYSYIFFDLSPSLGILEMNALTASDKIIIPVNAELFNMRVLQNLFKTIFVVKKYSNPSLEILGILFTRFKKNVNLHKMVKEQLINETSDINIRVFETVIRDSIIVADAQAEYKTVLQYAPKSKVADDYLRFIDEFIIYTEKGK